MNGEFTGLTLFFFTWTYTTVDRTLMFSLLVTEPLSPVLTETTPVRLNPSGGTGEWDRDRRIEPHPHPRRSRWGWNVPKFLFSVVVFRLFKYTHFTLIRITGEHTFGGKDSSLPENLKTCERKWFKIFSLINPEPSLFPQKGRDTGFRGNPITKTLDGGDLVLCCGDCCFSGPVIERGH